jgi:hypothetical protein
MTILKLSIAALAALMVGAWAEGAKATSGISAAPSPIAYRQ